MKKLYSYFKVLFVAAGLLVGANAWADGSKRVLNSQNYESATASDWTGNTAVTDFKTGDATYGKYAQMWASGSGNRGAYKTVSLAYVPDGSTTIDMATAGYNVEFDMQLRSGNVSARSTSQFLISASTINSGNSGYSGTDYFFSLSQPTRDADTYNTTWYINDLENSTGSTVVLDNSKWYHYAFVITATSVTYTISLNGESVATGNKTVESMPTIASFYTLIGRGGGLLNFDNLEIYDFTATATANAPTISLKAVSGANRIYTLENTNEGGTLYYTTAPADEAPAVGDAAYISTTDASKEVTYSESGKYYAYAVLGDGTTTSNITEENVTVGEIILPTPTYAITALDAGYAKTYTISAANNVLLNPTVALSYVFTPEGGAAQASVAMTGNTIAATEAGTYVVTSSAEGYTSSSVTIENNTAYKLVKTIDFTALTTSDFDAKWSSATGALDARWTSNASAIPADAAYYYLNSPAEDGADALDGITVTNPAQRQPQVYIGYGLFTPYATLSGNGNNLNITVNDATDDQLIVYQGWNNYGKTTFTTVQVGTATFYLYRTDTMLRIIKVYAPMTEEFVVVPVGEAGYATFCSDKALDFTGVEDVEAYTATVADGKVTFNKVEGAVPAGTGLLVKGISTNVPVAESAAAVESAFVGVTEDTEVAAGIYVLLNGESGVGFYKTKNAFTVGANKAYLPATASARTFIALDGETTGISSVVGGIAADGKVYNLQGQRVAQPVKGLYIQNGKKVVLK